MLAELEHVLEWTDNAIVSVSNLLASVVTKQTMPLIIGMLLVFAGVVFLIWPLLPPDKTNWISERPANAATCQKQTLTHVS